MDVTKEQATDLANAFIKQQSWEYGWSVKRLAVTDSARFEPAQSAWAVRSCPQGLDTPEIEVWISRETGNVLGARRRLGLRSEIEDLDFTQQMARGDSSSRNSTA